MYMSGFTGTSAILYINHDRAVLITDFRYTEQAASQAPDYEIVRYQGSIYDELNRLIESDEVSELSFEDSDLTYSQYTEYTQKLTAKLAPLGRMMEELRIVKDETEISLIRKAAEIADQVFSHILGFIRPGISEIEIAAEMEHHMRRLGAEGPSFETIVASGKRASMPHGVASEKT
jgi:Xaa-Pro aminopeptidase